jgi:hypothetical protein
MLFASKLIFVSFHQQESYSTAVDRMYEFVQAEDVWIINSCNMEPVKLFFAERQRERERGYPGVFLFLFLFLFLFSPEIPDHASQCKQFDGRDHRCTRFPFPL